MTAERRANLAVIRALVTRSKNELLRVPGAAIPGVLAPTIFFLGLNGVFGNLTELRGFEGDSYLSYIIPALAAAGGRLHRRGHRRQSGPRHRAGLVRPPARLPHPALGPAGRDGRLGQHPGADPRHGIALRGDPPRRQLARDRRVADRGGDGDGDRGDRRLLGSDLALRYKTQSAAPLMQAGMFILILFTTAYAPLDLLADWLSDIADVQPDDPGDRRGPPGLRRLDQLVGDLAGAAGAGRDCSPLLAALALRGMRRIAA